MWIDPEKVLKYDWSTLNYLNDIPARAAGPEKPWSSAPSFQRPSLPESSSQPTEVKKNVNCVSSTKSGRSIICEALPDTGHSGARSNQGMRIELLATSELDSDRSEPVTRQNLAQLTKNTARLIGSYQGHVVFLDHQCWLCTWEIDTDVSNYKRHFFLPRDWLSPSTLQLVTLNGHGTLLCPKNGEVGIVKNGIKL